MRSAPRLYRVQVAISGVSRNWVVVSLLLPMASACWTLTLHTRQGKRQKGDKGVVVVEERDIFEMNALARYLKPSCKDA